MQKNYFFTALVLCIFLSSCSQERLRPDAMPYDVEKFVERRDTCDHLRGEIPDPSEKLELDKVVDFINKYCTGIDARLDKLKNKYSKNKAIMERLDSYEPKIEGQIPNK